MEAVEVVKHGRILHILCSWLDGAAVKKKKGVNPYLRDLFQIFTED